MLYRLRQNRKSRKVTKTWEDSYLGTWKKLYGKGYFNPLKVFIMIAHHHSLSELFQLCTGHEGLESYFKSSLPREVTSANVAR